MIYPEIDSIFKATVPLSYSKFIKLKVMSDRNSFNNTMLLLPANYATKIYFHLPIS